MCVLVCIASLHAEYSNLIVVEVGLADAAHALKTVTDLEAPFRFIACVCVGVMVRFIWGTSLLMRVRGCVYVWVYIGVHSR